METIDLAAGPLRLALAPALGGAATAFWRETAQGRIDWMRPAPETARSVLETALYPLAPFSNRIGGARFVWRGDEIALAPNFAPEPHAIHGVGWTAPWRVAAQGADRATLRLDWPGGAGWPWAFEARLEYALQPEALRVTLGLRNADAAPFPSGLGLHPFFPGAAGVRLEAEGRLRYGPDGLPAAQQRPEAALAALRAGARIAKGLDHAHLGSGPAALVWPDRRLSIEAEETLPDGRRRPARWWILFAPPEQDFFCVEPTTHQPDAHNGRRPGVTEDGLVALEPGGEHRLAVRFDVSEQRAGGAWPIGLGQ